MGQYREIDFKQQHIDNYKLALVEIIKNNTTALFNEDIMSLLKKPPLDSMDVIKSKLIAIAKKEKIILKEDEVTQILDSYRAAVIKKCSKLKDEREKYLINIIEKSELVKEKDVYKINKKDLAVINKKIKKIYKDNISNCITTHIIKNISNIFMNDVDESKRVLVSNAVLKFLNSTYKRDLLDNIDFKILVKDTILINGIKEQGDRFLFTKMNSRLFSEDMEK